MDLNMSVESKENFGIFVGSETGLLKGLNVEKKSWRNLSKVEEVNKNNEINLLSWDDEEETKICAGRRSQQITILDSKTHEVVETRDCTGGEGPLRGIGKINGNYLTCSESGLVKLWADEKDDQVEFMVGPDIYKMKQCPWQKNVMATGGKENDLKVYDMTDYETPTFRAKNVRDDWLCLRVPVWITDLEFVPNSQRIVTSTGHHQVRMYDPLTSQRRPVVDMTFDEYPLTTMSIRPGGNQVVVGNTHGDVALLDLRGKGHVVQQYKGFAGSVRCVQCHPSSNVVAACGLDRFVRIYDIDTKSLLHKFYMKSRLNCLLMSSSWTCEEDKFKRNPTTPNKKPITKEQENEINEETENLWASLDVVQTKKLKRKPKHEKFETDINEIGTSSSKKRPKKIKQADETEKRTPKSKKPKNKS